MSGREEEEDCENEILAHRMDYRFAEGKACAWSGMRGFLAMQRLLCFGVSAFLGPTLSGRKIKEHNIQAQGLKQAPIGFSWGAKYLVTVIDSATIGGLRRRMTTVVAIFDNARDVDQAVTRLARAGFEDTVYDRAFPRPHPSSGRGTRIVGRFWRMLHLLVIPVRSNALHAHEN